MLALRHIDVRDIAFLGTNARAFKRYHALFSKLFEGGGVSNEFGHVSGYIQACERFGFRVAGGPVPPQTATLTGSIIVGAKNALLPDPALCAPLPPPSPPPAHYPPTPPPPPPPHTLLSYPP